MQKIENQVLEKLATRWHNQWVIWSKQVASEEPTISPERLSRWKTLWVDYDRLPESEKESDRLLAKADLLAVESGLPAPQLMAKRAKLYILGAVASLLFVGFGFFFVMFFGHGGIFELGGACSSVLFFLLFMVKEGNRVEFNDKVKLIRDFVDSEASR